MGVPICPVPRNAIVKLSALSFSIGSLLGFATRTGVAIESTPGDSLVHHGTVSAAFRGRCAVAGVTIDIPASDDELLAEARAAFHAWTALLAEQLTVVGVARERAAGIATIALACVKGAHSLPS